MTWRRSASRWSPGSPPTATGTTCSGTPGSATCHAMPRTNARAAREARERAQAMAAESASGVPLELIGLLTPLPADGRPVPGTLVRHEAHAVGHAAVLLADRGVLLAGDMLSDALIPLLDPRRRAGGRVRGGTRPAGRGRHARRCRGPRPRRRCRGARGGGRLAADRAYIDALRRGAEPVDARLDQDSALRPPPVEPGASPTLTRMKRPDLVDVLEMPPGRGSRLHRRLSLSRPRPDRPRNTCRLVSQNEQNRRSEALFCQCSVLGLTHEQPAGRPPPPGARLRPPAA